MKTKAWAILLMVVCTAFTSTAQILYKAGADKLDFGLASAITNWQLLLGIMLYLVGAVLVIVAFRGGNVSTLYPIITSSYIWVAIGSIYYFNENVTPLRWVGILLIIVGIVTITLGEEKEVVELTEPV